jgi:hypothetical protein
VEGHPPCRGCDAEGSQAAVASIPCVQAGMLCEPGLQAEFICCKQAEHSNEILMGFIWDVFGWIL